MSTFIQSTPELLSLSRAAAEGVAGHDAVEDVDVGMFLDSTGEPAYMFAVLIDPERTRLPAGRLYVELYQRPRDALEDRQDTHFALLRILDRQDWAQRNWDRPSRA